ncbi:hypothetical protein PVK06_034652 [Gossypium arboreum]|uniref:Cytochrome c oxidase assembly factor 3 mitochondrial coiled-coil domain-containing protein n=1 Tax=Gossypium arboreum TaxID=29729 RepID=A0ABR0NHU1_GOSAR|nr:hypothetical protein PVK06_034652 [Gossypium arboreum]
MAGLFAYGSLAPKTKNMVVAGGLTAFVFGVYFYTMRAVGDLSISGLILPKHDHRQIPQKPLQTHYPSPSCVVAKGALHGDLEKIMQAFRLGGLIDGSNYWFDVDRKRGLGLLIPEHSPVQVEGKAWKFRVSELPKAVASLSTASIFVFRKHNEL